MMNSAVSKSTEGTRVHVYLLAPSALSFYIVVNPRRKAQERSSSGPDRESQEGSGASEGKRTLQSQFRARIKQDRIAPIGLKRFAGAFRRAGGKGNDE